MKTVDFDTLESCARSVGLSLVAVVESPDLRAELPRLQRWQELGYAGEMSYMGRPAELLANPQRLFDGLRSVVVVGVQYAHEERQPLRAGFGRVARYAWGRDYHKVLRARLRNLVAAVERALGHAVSHRVFSDSVPLLERALATASGLGFVGKNTMVITPRLGSFMFLGEVLWDLHVAGVPVTPATQLVPAEKSVPHHGKSHCGACSRCVDQCPTGAFVDEYQLDARRCISYLTIEKRGELSRQERRWLGEWIFGCDVCQEVCPFNAVSIKMRRPADLAEFESGAGVGQALSLVTVLRLRSDREFIAHFAGTALMRAKREGLLRNAAVVAANTNCYALLPDLETVIREDPSALVRQHALWSHWELSKTQGSRARHYSQELLASHRNDLSSGVRNEVEVCLASE